ncbi:MAG: glutamate--tRNA ligase, partial [Candidatus Aminicenantes bacterium]|nr:glutamate--tRNA ligase [Candidatus Aminicenantes bacterium]
MVRVRFAPSPTGHLHIGAARTALYNWIFARSHGGQFILRIEDTDMERSSQKMSQGILDGLTWMGIDWDEGPFFQSQRKNTYLEQADKLVERDLAYYCFCTPEDIARRKAAWGKDEKEWKYDRYCLNLSPDEIKNLRLEGKVPAIRFKVPDGEIHYNDLVHGPITVKNTNIEDFVLVRADGTPTYHLSVVVDDILMKITHIIRGDDHISNTPKQILLYMAFRQEPPEFGHHPLILGPDKKKLSKRHGVTSVLQFREEGFLPLALVNYLVQMSWVPDEEKIFTREEIIKFFSFKKRIRGNPIFDVKKLEWLNGKLISMLPAEDLYVLLKERLKDNGLWYPDLVEERREWFFRLLDLLKERNRTLNDFIPRARPFLSDDYPLDPEGKEKYLSDSRLPRLLQKLVGDFEELEDFSAQAAEQAVRERAAKEEVKAGLFIHAVRMLVLGMPVSPGIFDVLELLGKKKSIERIKKYI